MFDWLHHREVTVDWPSRQAIFLLLSMTRKLSPHQRPASKQYNLFFYQTQVQSLPCIGTQSITHLRTHSLLKQNGYSAHKLWDPATPFGRIWSKFVSGESGKADCLSPQKGRSTFAFSMSHIFWKLLVRRLIWYIWGRQIFRNIVVRNWQYELKPCLD